jgi:carboxyl-terminal processing protease
MFFGFADNYYYKNTETDFSKLEEEKLYEAFKQYLEDANFKYTSEAEKQIDKLIKDIKSSSAREEFNGELDNIKAQIGKISAAEMRIFRKEIIREIKAELASRYLGTSGRTKELMKNDEQLHTAVNILDDDAIYRKLLNSPL